MIDNIKNFQARRDENKMKAVGVKDLAENYDPHMQDI